MVRHPGPRRFILRRFIPGSPHALGTHARNALACRPHVLARCCVVGAPWLPRSLAAAKVKSDGEDEPLAEAEPGKPAPLGGMQKRSVFLDRMLTKVQKEQLYHRRREEANRQSKNVDVQ